MMIIPISGKGCNGKKRWFEFIADRNSQYQNGAAIRIYDCRIFPFFDVIMSCEIIHSRIFACFDPIQVTRKMIWFTRICKTGKTKAELFSFGFYDFFFGCLIHYFGLLKKILVYQSRACTATKILSKMTAPSLAISSQ